jgi:hypothetical protein
MKVIKRIALGLAMACLPAGTPLLAQQSYGQYYDYVFKVGVHDDNFLYIDATVSGAVTLATNHGCQNLAFARSKYPIGDDRTKAWLQIALASQLSRKKIYIQTEGCNPNPGFDYPTLMNLQICDGDAWCR